ncbi:hypothetical protein J437_LFUL017855, partial [Ladona fulva]
MMTAIVNRLGSLAFRYFSNTSMRSEVLRLGVVQLRSTENKNENLDNAKYKMIELVEKNCDVIVLPECFNSPYG